jgi:predicted nucleic acid-binding Zn ribbon protein
MNTRQQHSVLGVCAIKKKKKKKKKKTMWHYLLGTIYIFLGVVSLFGNGVVIR